MWLHNIHRKGLQRKHIKDVQGDEKEERIAARRQMVEEILEDILRRRIVEFPPGTTVTDIYDMLDREGHGELDHEGFVIGIGRILLADSFQISCDNLINVGRARRIHREEERRQAARTRANQEQIAEVAQRAIAAEEHAAAASKQAASGQERLGRIEQQLAKLAAK